MHSTANDEYDRDRSPVMEGAKIGSGLMGASKPVKETEKIRIGVEFPISVCMQDGDDSRRVI